MPGRMALPKNIQWVTFDVYGTLIDWESGVADAFEREAKRDGFPIDRQQVIDLFLAATAEIQGGSYELYAEVLRQAAVKVAKEIGWSLEPSRSGFLPDSVARWGAFKEANPQLKKFLSKYQTGLISNIDDKLLGQTRRHIPADVDLVVTAQQVRSYKPDPAHFNEFARRIGGKKGWVHIAAGLHADIEPATKLKVPTIWVNRHKAELPAGAKKPTAEVKSLLEAAKLLGL
jgi:2-haloacid dehalogenase